MILALMRMIATGDVPFAGALIWAMLAFDALLAIPLYNILLRLGSHYEFDDGRIVQYAKDDCVVTSEDVQEESGREPSFHKSPDE